MEAACDVDKQVLAVAPAPPIHVDAPAAQDNPGDRPTHRRTRCYSFTCSLLVKMSRLLQ